MVFVNDSVSHVSLSTTIFSGQARLLHTSKCQLPRDYYAYWRWYTLRAIWLISIGVYRVNHNVQIYTTADHVRLWCVCQLSGDFLHGLDTITLSGDFNWMYHPASIIQSSRLCQLLAIRGLNRYMYLNKSNFRRNNWEDSLYKLLQMTLRWYHNHALYTWEYIH